LAALTYNRGFTYAALAPVTSHDIPYPSSPQAGEVIFLFLSNLSNPELLSALDLALLKLEKRLFRYAKVGVGCYGPPWVAGTGDVLFRKNQGAEANIVSRPNGMVVLIDDLDKQSIARRKRGEDGEEQPFRGVGGSGGSLSGSGITGANRADCSGAVC
jgi:hypothetical protein